MPRDYSQAPTAYQRLPEYTRDDDWIRAFLHEAKIGHIASTWDDQPFLTPSNFWFDEAQSAGHLPLEYRRARARQPRTQPEGLSGSQ